jgi:hypothetical protein
LLIEGSFGTSGTRISHCSRMPECLLLVSLQGSYPDRLHSHWVEVWTYACS